jgi:hypothetical protein
VDWNESWVTVGTGFGRGLAARLRDEEGERGAAGGDRCGRWKKSLQKVKSDQAEGCTIVQGMKALD